MASIHIPDAAVHITVTHNEDGKPCSVVMVASDPATRRAPADKISASARDSATPATKRIAEAAETPNGHEPSASASNHNADQGIRFWDFLPKDRDFQIPERLELFLEIFDAVLPPYKMSVTTDRLRDPEHSKYHEFFKSLDDSFLHGLICMSIELHENVFATQSDEKYNIVNTNEESQDEDDDAT